MGDDEFDATIDDMKAQLGVELDRDLAQELGIRPTAISAWRSRKKIPVKYLLRYSRKRDERAGDVKEPYAFARLREAYVFCLVDILSRRLDTSLVGLAPNNFFEIWRGFKLSDGYSYFQDILSTNCSRDELRAQFEKARVEIDTEDFVEWLEGLGR